MDHLLQVCSAAWTRWAAKLKLRMQQQELQRCRSAQRMRLDTKHATRHTTGPQAGATTFVTAEQQGQQEQHHSGNTVSQVSSGAHPGPLEADMRVLTPDAQSTVADVDTNNMDDAFAGLFVSRKSKSNRAAAARQSAPASGSTTVHHQRQAGRLQKQRTDTSPGMASYAKHTGVPSRTLPAHPHYPPAAHHPTGDAASSSCESVASALASRKASLDAEGDKAERESGDDLIALVDAALAQGSL